MMEQNANQEQSAPPPKPKFNLFDLLSVLLLIGLVVMLGVFALIFVNPYTPLNPFPPSSPPLPQLVELPTATATPIFPPTWTPTVTLAPTATLTPQPPATAAPAVIPGASPTPEGGSQGPVETPTATPVTSGSPYALRGEVMAFPSSAFNSDLGCNWAGVGGQVTDLQGSPVIGLTVQLGGGLNGASTYMLGLTGTAIQYGRAGYEFKLADQPVASKQSLWIQLLDQAGLALSDRIYFDTYNDCQKNLILINFKQVH